MVLVSSVINVDAPSRERNAECRQAFQFFGRGEGRIANTGKSAYAQPLEPHFPEELRSMAMDAGEIERLIRAKLPDAMVEIRDLAGDGDHYAAHVVSAAFKGKSRVQQHQMVYEAFGRADGRRAACLGTNYGGSARLSAIGDLEPWAPIDFHAPIPHIAPRSARAHGPRPRAWGPR